MPGQARLFQIKVSPMTSTFPAALALSVAAFLAFCPGHAAAQGVAGNRLFPTTLTIQDPAVEDELSLPTFARRIGRDGEREDDYSFEFSKRITEKLGFSIGDAFSQVRPGGSGLRNLETALKYQAYVNPEHEVLVAVGVRAEIGGTGARALGEGFTSLGPQVYFGKGFGDLPTSLDRLRPLALTGQVGLLIPTRARSVTTTPNPDNGDADVDIDRHPTLLNWGFSLQYSLPYRNEHVSELGGPAFFKRLIPLVEVSLVSPVAYGLEGRRTTTGTVNPGVLYAGEGFQLGVEALLPINGASGKHTGFIAQLHFFLEDLFPDSIGRPIFAEEEHKAGAHEAEEHAAARHHAP